MDKPNPPPYDIIHPSILFFSLPHHQPQAMPNPATITLEATPRWPAEVRCDAAVPADTYRATTATTRAPPARKRPPLR